MTSPYVKTTPRRATVEEMRDYLEWHVQNGRGKYQVEMRDHLWCIPPEHMTHVDDERLVIVTGINPAM